MAHDKQRGGSLKLYMNDSEAGLLRRVLKLRRDMGTRSKDTLARIAREEWSRAVADAERTGFDWRTWLTTRQFRCSTPLVGERGPDAPGSQERARYAVAARAT